MAVIQKLVILFIQLHLQLQRAVIHADLQGIGQEAILAVRDVNTIVVLVSICLHLLSFLALLHFIGLWKVSGYRRVNYVCVLSTLFCKIRHPGSCRHLSCR